MADMTTAHLGTVIAAGDKLMQAAKSGVAARVASAGGIEPVQHAAHGLAWLATYVEALRQTVHWAGELEREGRIGEIERLIVAVAMAEYAGQICGGIPMSQGEIVRPADLGIASEAVRRFEDETAGVRDAAGADRMISSSTSGPSTARNSRTKSSSL